MAYLTKQQVKEIIENAPEGTTPQGIVAGLRQKGYELEGYPKVPETRPETTAEHTEGFLQSFLKSTSKVGEFLGLGGLGRGVAGTIFTQTKEYKDLLEQLRTGKITQEKFDEITKGVMPSNKEVIGSAIQTGATIATAGLGAVKGATVPIRIAQAGLQQGAVGTVMGIGKGIEENKPAKEVLGQGIKTGVISGAIGAGIQGGSELVKFVAEKFPKRIMQSVLKQSKAEKLAGKDVAEYAINKAKIGTTDSLINGSKAAINNLDDQIDTQLAKGTAKGVNVSNKSIFQKVADNINKNGGEITPEEVKEITTKLSPQAKGLLGKNTWTITEANSVRKLLDRTLGNKVFVSQQLPFNKDVAMSVSNTLRGTVQSSVPSTASLFKELSKEITFRNALLNKSATMSKSQIISLTDLVAAGIGIPGGLPGVIGSVGVKKAITSTPVSTGIAVGINQLNKKITPLLGKLTPIERITVLNAIKNLISSSK